METMTIPTFKFALRADLENEKQFLPTRAESKASGWDVKAAFKDHKPLTIKPFEQVKIPLGVRSFCPDGWWYELRPRSSSFAKKNMHALYGVIDETYEGELLFACQYIPPVGYRIHQGVINTWHEPDPWQFYCETNKLTIAFGEPIGQLIPKRRDEMEVLEVTNEEFDALCATRNSERGAGGFGSSDRK